MEPRRTSARRVARAVLAGAVTLAAAAAPACGASRASSPSPATTRPQVASSSPSPARRPNVVVFVTDDQTLGAISPQVTPNIERWFVRGGRTYTHFSVTDPLCCPSRAATMTGRYDHNNGVKDNNVAAFHLDLATTLECYLQPAGYRTGLYGKFYNGYDYADDPPCLSDYAITRGSAHRGLWFRANGVMVQPPGWQDEYIDRESVAFLDARAREPDVPFYLYESTLEPHGPYASLPADVASRPVPWPSISPSVYETPAEMALKSPLIRANADQHGFDLRRWRAQERMMMNVDRYVGDTFAALRRNGQLQNTIVIFLSDNGALLGEHHLLQKRLPYTESIMVPAYVYGPRWVGAGPSTDARLTENVDIFPTIMQAAGLEPRLIAPIDGRSLLDPRWRRPYALGESWHASAFTWQPRWRSIRSQTFQYIEYLTDGRRPQITWREYYDLRTDPHEMHNLLADADPANDPDVAWLHAAVVDAMQCAGTQGARACP